MLGVGSEEADVRRYIELGVTMLEFAHDVAIVHKFLGDKVSKYS
jgi:hypothetical protein